MPAADYKPADAINTVWVDSNGHTFTVEAAHPSTTTDFAGDTLLEGTSSNCPGLPVCFRDHNGPHSITDDLDNIAVGHIFGFDRTSPPAEPWAEDDDEAEAATPAVDPETKPSLIPTSAEAVALGHRLGAGTYCAVCDRIWDDPAAHRASLTAPVPETHRDALVSIIQGAKTISAYGIADAVLAAGWAPLKSHT